MRETAKSHFSLMKRCAVTAWCVFVFACAAVLAGLPLQAFASEEVEPNYQTDSSNHIAIGETVTGSFAPGYRSYEDSDVFNLVTEGSNNFAIQLTLPSHSQGNTACSVKLFDNLGYSVNWDVKTGYGDGSTYTWTSDKLSLSAGQYFVRVYADRYDEAWHDRYQLVVYDDTHAPSDATDSTGSATDPSQVENSGISTRLAGNEADETSSAISSAAFESSEWAILARLDDFADAMSARGLAGVLKAPIILTDRYSLSESAASELKRLGVKNVYIIGGKGAIPADLESQLKANGVTGTVKRVYGEEFYDTSVECAKKIAEHGGDCTRAIVAYGQNFQDALSISSFAYKYGVPIFLQTAGATSADRALPKTAQTLLKTGDYANATIYVPGGPGAVSKASTESVFGDDLRGGARIYGQTGYDTSNEIAKYVVGQGLLSAETVCIATGAEAAKGVDALAGAALAGKAGGVMLLASAQSAMEATDYTTIDGFLNSNLASVKSCYILGGTYVLPTDFKAKVESMLG